MAAYYQDRRFTDYVHSQLAEPLIYESLGWSTVPMDAEELERMDINEGVDYVMWKENGDMIGVQERFRDAEYAKYTDATLRYRRDGNRHSARVKSEFYKIRAHYLVYGITNGSKRKQKRETLTGFIKWVILDLDFLRKKFKEGGIVIDRERKWKRCRRDGDKLLCPEMFNHDGSSSFLPFDVPLLKDLWGREPILAEKGFLP